LFDNPVEVVLCSAIALYSMTSLIDLSWKKRGQIKHDIFALIFLGFLQHVLFNLHLTRLPQTLGSLPETPTGLSFSPSSQFLSPNPTL
jgi:hypothetical protein